VFDLGNPFQNFRARPEQTQLEELSKASFLGKLLVFPANVRLEWKVIARYKHSSLFGLIVCNKEKSSITLTPGRPCSWEAFPALSDVCGQGQEPTLKSNLGRLQPF